MATKQKITKEFIISYLQNYYNTKNDIPKSRDTTHPFSEGTVRNRFGNWSNALTEAGIPLRVNPSQLVNCKHCNVEFIKKYNDIQRSPNHFCSYECSATYNNSKRIITDEMKQKISDRVKQYNIDNPRVKKIKYCVICKNPVNLKKRKTCSTECFKIANSQGGVKGGTISASLNVRRSKGEIHFAKLCEEYFGKENIKCNELIFKDNNNNFWDADIFINFLMICIIF